MDTKKIKELIEIFEDSRISKMDLTDGSLHLTLEKNETEVESIPVKRVEEGSSNKVENTKSIKSPLVGTFYIASGEGKEPYIHIGDTIHKGDVICIIESMKVMNELKADQDGKVVSIPVENGQSIEYDQVLVVLE